MKVILTGATGFIGSAVLDHALSHPAITSLIILSRKPIPALDQSPKARVILMPDFTVYSPAVLHDLAGADACIWSLGTYNGDNNVEVNFPLAFLTAIAETQKAAESSSSSDGTGSRKFRHLHLGGALTELNQDASLWYLEAARKGRGLGEKKVAAFAQEDRQLDGWQIWIVKPCFVLPSKGIMSTALEYVIGTGSSIRVSELAAAMVETVVSGEGDPILDNRALVIKGREALKSFKG